MSKNAPLILHIDTATATCSVAVSKGEDLLYFKDLDEGYSHAEKLFDLIKEALSHVQSDMKSFDAVSVSNGPGSYTGLRIGLSTAKGLAFGADLKLIGINSLHCLNEHPELESVKGLRVPMIDARRMEVYAAFYRNRKEIKSPHPLLLEEYDFSIYQESVTLFGDGADKAETLYQNLSNVHIIKGVKSTARELVRPALEKFQQKQFEDIAYSEPLYLKQFIPGKPKRFKL